MLGRAIRMIFPGLILTSVMVLRIVDPPKAAPVVDLSALPREILGLTGEDLRVEDVVVEELDSTEILIRSYRRTDGTPIWVVLIYFANARLGGHDPQLCYVSQGFQVRDLPDLPSPHAETAAILAERFEATRQGRRERVATFWYAGGGWLLPRHRDYTNRLFLQGVRENRTYGIFVRVSTLARNNETEADAWNASFVAEVTKHLPRLLGEGDL